MDFEIRKDRKAQGRKKLTRERAAYFQLMHQGYSSMHACRIVGIDPGLDGLFAASAPSLGASPGR
ncbi:hypothetical protein GCM10009555_092850 [Acrocarpospora macrocephala]|uniref:Uncharacterized protein n=1 Tax=Acrocarpospora macrocephala TaxID=150177 RepID=A0A5M3X661_9ACTN|nr:hypothetical protein [Acrocarpospora macrocephala]GES16156.1 hypothetical protein Amac_097540 [Acrocarpospora macrocephala]